MHEETASCWSDCLHIFSQLLKLLSGQSRNLKRREFPYNYAVSKNVGGSLPPPQKNPLDLGLGGCLQSASFFLLTD